MPEQIAFLHTVPSLIQEFNTLGSSLLPGVMFFHVLDEIMLEHIHQSGAPDSYDRDRLLSHVRAAEQIGAGALVVTCSMLTNCIDEIQPAVGIPIIKIDEALTEQAIKMGTTIGMLATNEDTIAPSSQMLYEEAARMGKVITVIPVHVPNAFSAIRKGENEIHDRLVKQCILETSQVVDVIVLAQASIARVLLLLPENERNVPILSSPQLALEQAKQAIRRESS